MFDSGVRTSDAVASWATIFIAVTVACISNAIFLTLTENYYAHITLRAIIGAVDCTVWVHGLKICGSHRCVEHRSKLISALSIGYNLGPSVGAAVGGTVFDHGDGGNAFSVFQSSFCVSAFTTATVGAVLLMHWCYMPHGTAKEVDFSSDPGDPEDVARPGDRTDVEEFEGIKPSTVAETFEDDNTVGSGSGTRRTLKQVRMQLSLVIGHPLAQSHLISLVMQLGAGAGFSLVLLPFLLQDRHQLSASQIAGVMATSTVIAVASAIITGKLLSHASLAETGRKSSALLALTGIAMMMLLVVESQWWV